MFNASEEERPLPDDNVTVSYFIVGDNDFGSSKSLMNHFEQLHVHV